MQGSPLFFSSYMTQYFVDVNACLSISCHLNPFPECVLSLLYLLKNKTKHTLFSFGTFDIILVLVLWNLNNYIYICSVVKTLTTGDYFGEIALLKDDSIRTANIVVHSPVVQVVSFDRTGFERALGSLKAIIEKKANERLLYELPLIANLTDEKVCCAAMCWTILLLFQPLFFSFLLVIWDLFSFSFSFLCLFLFALSAKPSMCISFMCIMCIISLFSAKKRLTCFKSLPLIKAMWFPSAATQTPGLFTSSREVYSFGNTPIQRSWLIAPKLKLLKETQLARRHYSNSRYRCLQI